MFNGWKFSTSLLTLWIFMVSFLSTAAQYELRDRILRRDLQHLVLYSEKYTNGRRLAPAPQLQRIGGDAPGKFNPKEVHCYRVSIDGDHLWECEGGLDSTVEFGKINVACEGYDHQNDTYVLVESCGLSYELVVKRTSVLIWLILIFVSLWIIALTFWCCILKEGYSASGFKTRKSRRGILSSTRNFSIPTDYGEDTIDEESRYQEFSSSKKKSTSQKFKDKNGNIHIVINV